MVFIPIGYSSPSLMDISEVRGGSPWGAATLAGTDGSRMPSEAELGIAEHQGKHAGAIMLKLAS